MASISLPWVNKILPVVDIGFAYGYVSTINFLLSGHLNRAVDTQTIVLFGSILAVFLGIVQPSIIFLKWRLDRIKKDTHLNKYPEEYLVLQNTVARLQPLDMLQKRVGIAKLEEPTELSNRIINMFESPCLNKAKTQLIAIPYLTSLIVIIFLYTILQAWLAYSVESVMFVVSAVIITALSIWILRYRWSKLKFDLFKQMSLLCVYEQLIKGVKEPQFNWIRETISLKAIGWRQKDGLNRMSKELLKGSQQNEVVFF